VSNPQTTPTAEGVEYNKLLLGHRTRVEKVEGADQFEEISYYEPAPVRLARPAKRREDTSVQCAMCGQMLRVRLWDSIESRRAGRRRWWYAFGLFTAVIWSLFGAVASAVSDVHLLRGVAVLSALLWSAVLLAGWIAQGGADPLHNDAWVKVLRGRGKHRMLLPGQTRVVFSYAREVSL
jgi:hypothetical protein